MSNAKHLQEVAPARGLSRSQILSHDLTSTSVIFEGDFSTKTSSESALVTEIETCLAGKDEVFYGSSNMRTEVTIDFMSTARQTVVGSEMTFGEFVDKPVRRARALCQVENYHIVYDSYETKKQLCFPSIPKQKKNNNVASTEVQSGKAE